MVLEVVHEMTEDYSIIMTNFVAFVILTARICIMTDRLLTEGTDHLSNYICIVNHSRLGCSSCLHLVVDVGSHC